MGVCMYEGTIGPAGELMLSWEQRGLLLGTKKNLGLEWEEEPIGAE